MNKTFRQILFWTPRIMGILFVLFTSLFALDVFDMGLGFWETFFALLIHLIPTLVLSLAIALAWKWEWVGALLFLGWAIVYVLRVQGFHWSVYLINVGVPAVIGLLFLAGWVWRNQIRMS